MSHVLYKAKDLDKGAPLKTQLLLLIANVLETALMVHFKN